MRCWVYEWLPETVSQSVLLWDGVKLEMKRVARGHTKITLLPKTIEVNEAPRSFNLFFAISHLPEVGLYKIPVSRPFVS
jgi:hypothetical protein